MFNTYDNESKVINIPINAVKPNPYKTRKFYDITSVSELADSIKEVGLLQPISVRRLKSDTYELISGERRLRAAEIAGFSEISAYVLDISDNMSAILTLAENIQRKDINFFEVATACYHLVFEHNVSKGKLARSMGVSESYVSRMLSLSKLSRVIKNIITENHFTEAHALQLLRLRSEDMRLEALKKAIEFSMTPHMFEKYIDKVLEDEAKPDRFESRKKIVKYTGATDYKIIFNTIREAVRLVSDTGVKTKAKRFEREKYFEYVIRISK